MRIWFSIIAVGLFISSIFQPVLPVYNYFLNYNYIVNVLCINKDKPELHCDGKCYLKQEISENYKLDTNTKKALANYQFKPVPVYFETALEFESMIIHENRNDDIFFQKNFFTDIFIEISLPPPRV